MKQILVVDDDQSIRSILTKRLEMANVEVFALDSGEACLEYLKENQVSLILMDYSMPGLSGVEVISSIREKFSKEVLPIIMVTSKNEPRDMNEAFKAGANDYLTKPLFLNIAKIKIQALIEISEYYQELISKQEDENNVKMALKNVEEFFGAVPTYIKPTLSEIEQSDIDQFYSKLNGLIQQLNQIKK